MLKPLQGGCVVADVIASGRWKNHKVNYFNFSSEVLNTTSSQTCGRFSDTLHVYIKLLGKIFSLGPDEARSNLLKACLSYQKIVLLLRKHIDSPSGMLTIVSKLLQDKALEEGKEYEYIPIHPLDPGDPRDHSNPRKKGGPAAPDALPPELKQMPT